MSALPPVHLCIVQPAGYVHSLGFLDQARQFRFQFRRHGAQVTLAKNRLRHGAINFVFGAHLGFDAAQTSRHACVFVNLEQLGEGGARVSADYLALLSSSAVVDYDADNLAGYGRTTDDVPLVPFLYAPYLTPAEPIPLEDRPIDLLFFGSMNPRRAAWIERIEALGVNVSVFDSALYGPERDHHIAQAKAVLNVHFYESSRFEQARVSHCLSLGTPVISERTERTNPHAAFEDSVLWINSEAELEQFFREDFNTPAYFDAMRGALDHFRGADAVEAYADLLAFAVGFHRQWQDGASRAPWQPHRINLNPGKAYQPGWLNLDVAEHTNPDLLLDLSAPVTLPLHLVSDSLGPVLLEPGSVEHIQAHNVLEHVPQLSTLMDNCLRLLAVGGELHIEVPLEGSPTAWQGPTHVREFNASSWSHYTDGFWHMGWFDHRFEMGDSTYLDAAMQPCPREQAVAMRLTLRKVETTDRERTAARTFQTDLRLPEDGVLPQEMYIAGSPQPVATPSNGIPAPHTQGGASGGLIHVKKNSQPELTVVCVSYKRYQQLPILVHSLLTQTVPSFKLLVLHDGPDERMQGILEGLREQSPDQIDYVFTEQRFNDYGHTLRDMGIRMADTPYLLITNDDNYYCPKFIELMVPPMKANEADIAMCNMIHSHDHPGCRPQPSYMPFETRPERGSVDIGCFIARTDWAQRVGFRDKSHDGDATYFEDLLSCAEQPTVLKVNRTLFVHN